MEKGISSRKRTVLPIIRNVTQNPYCSFKELQLIISEAKVTKKEWRSMIKVLMEVDIPQPIPDVDDDAFSP